MPNLQFATDRHHKESRKANWTCRAVVAVLVYCRAVGLKRPEPVKTSTEPTDGVRKFG